MTTVAPPTDATWTPERRRLRDWLGRQGAGLAEAYSAAVELVARGPFEGAGTLLAHALRDLINRLPDAVCGQTGERMDASKRLDDLKAVWQEEGMPLDLPRAKADGDIPLAPEATISERLYGEIQAILREQGEATSRRLDNAKRLFQALMPRGVEPTVAVVTQWVALGKWAVANGHFNADAPRSVEWPGCVGKLEVLEATLGGVAYRFFEVTDELDEILEDTNS
jgi:hypothetical protein